MNKQFYNVARFIKKNGDYIKVHSLEKSNKLNKYPKPVKEHKSYIMVKIEPDLKSYKIPLKLLIA